MQIQKIIETIQAKKSGQFLTVESKRECKTKEGSPRFFKASKMQMRVAHNYYNQKSTKEAHASGERKQAQASDLWHQASELGKAFRQHKKNKTVYVAGQPSGNKPQVEFLTESGKKVEKSEISDFLLASEKKSSEKSDFCLLKLETLTSAK